MKTYQTQTVSPSRLTLPTRGPISGTTCVLGAAINGTVGGARGGADRPRGGDIFVMGSTPATKGAFWDFHAWSPPI